MSFFVDKHELAEKKDIVNPNLFTGSKDFTGSKWINIQANAQTDKYLDFTAIFVNWSWNGVSQYIAVNQGETFTVSAYVKAEAGCPINWYITMNNDSENGYQKANASADGAPITTTGDWQKVSLTFTITGTITGGIGAIKPRIEDYGSVPYWIAGMKLERGAIATDWCPALEDYAMKSDFDALNARIPTQTITSDITENVMSWEANTMDAAGVNNTLRILAPITSGTRFTSKFIKVLPNETVSVEVDPLANKNFLWMYYLTDSPQAGSKVYNSSADWVAQNLSTTFNTGDAKYIIFLVGDNNGFTGVNTWKLKFTHNVNLVIEG